MMYDSGDMFSSPVYEFPYSGPPVSSEPPLLSYQTNLFPSNLTVPLNYALAYPSSTFTPHNTSHIDSLLGGNRLVYRVPDYVPLETILRQLGVDVSSLRPSNQTHGYYTSASEPIELIIPPPSHRRRRLVCHEVSDSDSEDYYGSSSRHHRRRTSRSPSHNPPPPGLHNMLANVRRKSERVSGNIARSNTAPSMNSQWQGMQNSRPPISANLFSNLGSSPENYGQPPSGPLVNQQAVQNFLAARNLPPGVNQPGPSSGQAAIGNFLAARYIPAGANQPPPPMQNPAAVQNFFATRNLPYGVDRSNPAVANAWNGAEPAAPNYPSQVRSFSPPPRLFNPAWNAMQQRPRPPSMFGPPRAPFSTPAPVSFGSLLSQAHQRRSNFAGAA